MRFAITLLCVICIASVIGTVVKQNEPLNNYINQFGPFWADVFGRFHLFNVYSAPWFLLILGFLVLSTSLCIARNTPKILNDLRSFKEHVRAQSLKAFHHKAEGELAANGDVALQQVSDLLARRGWQARAQVREDGTMVAARQGRLNKIGYLAAHSAVVLVCLGGLFDGDLVVRAQMWLTGKSTFEGGGLIKDVAPEHRLPATNPTFRGNLFVPEGGRAGTAVLSMPNGIVLQDLDFDVELKKFIVEYYDTGMPKLFASKIVLHDHDTGATTEAMVKVNEPVFHRGVAIYQSSFEDGGSLLELTAQPLAGNGPPLVFKGRIGDSLPLTGGGDKYTLELTGLRVINVENLGEANAKGTDVRKVDLGGALDKHLGAGINPDKKKQLHNVGPSFTYKLRDASGQAREFQNYMLPLEIDGQRVFVMGVREATDENFRYLRIPVDDQNSMNGWLHLRRALADPALRRQAAQRYADSATPANRPEMRDQLRVTGERALALFAGAEKAAKSDPVPGGLAALSQFIEGTVPQADRQRVADVLLRILNGSLFELEQMARQADGLAPLPSDASTQAFMTQAVMALSDSYFYPAPLMMQLSGFNQVQASVFQVARAPGKKLVYLGAVLLILGVFAMLYIRERRLWVWLSPAGDGHTRVLMAMSTPRRTLDIDADFNAMRQDLLGPSALSGDTTR
ncbi:cytochrome c biogenesis protein ResB [Ideonella dechloratans]|uniref:Cytochrome c biogenesis protein ResB n=2 Tax=Ideonella dechloratans TaxID=36863 RepID=A0A643FAR7_IDEDE|nr:cytochrome c biogenesis protein ResB [Ideonella dechloratans]